MITDQLNLFLCDFRMLLLQIEGASTGCEEIRKKLEGQRRTLQFLIKQIDVSDVAISLRSSLTKLRTNIDYAIVELPKPKTLYQTLSQSYESILYQARKNSHFRDLSKKNHTLRPTNYTRNLVHIGNGLFAFSLYECNATLFENVEGKC